MSTSIEDNELPKAILTRIIKRAVPDNTNIQSNAKLAMSKSTTVFINYLTATANEAAQAQNHKIINASHVFKALEMLDLEEMIPELTTQFEAYQKLQKSKKSSKAGAKEDDVGSKKRKPSSGSSPKGKSKALKGGSGETPGQRAGEEDVEMEGDDDDEDNDEQNGEEEEDNDVPGSGEDDDAEGEEEEEDGENGHSQGTKKAELNMQDKEEDDEQRGSHSDEEGEDSDGF